MSSDVCHNIKQNKQTNKQQQTNKTKRIHSHKSEPKTMQLSLSLSLSLFLSHINFIFFSLLVGCLTSQQHASVSQGRICSDNFTYCHCDIAVADQTLHLSQSQYTDTGLTSPSTDPITPSAWQGSHWSANFKLYNI